MALQNFLRFAQGKLDLEPPLRVIAGFTGIKGFQMTAPRGVDFKGLEKFRGEAVESEIIWEGTVDDWKTAPDEILMPFFQKVWHELGLERPDAPN